MPPVEHAVSTLIGQWGPAGVIVVGLAAAVIAMFRYFNALIDKLLTNSTKEREEIKAQEKAERAEMRATHAAERAELQRANQQNFDQSLAVSKENTASNRAVEQVIRELTGQLGGIKEWAKTRQNGG